MGVGSNFGGGVSSSVADGSITIAKLADGSVTTSKIVDGAVTGSKLASSFKQTLFNRNYLINPAFSVNQDAISGTLPNSLALPTASLGYPSKSNWCFAASGSASVAYVVNSANESVTFTGAASTTAIYLLQRLESKDITTLANKLATVTLSAETSNSLLTSVIWEVFRPTTADTHGTIATPTQTLIASGTWTVSSTLTRYSATVTLPAEAANGLEVRLRVGAQTSGTWVVSRLQLEEGSVATNFICDDYLTELNRSQRYFRRLSDYLYVYFASSSSLSSEQLHTNMFGTTRIRNLIAGNGISGTSVSISAGLNEDSTRASYTSTGAGYFGGNPLYTVSAHIP